MKHTKTEVIKYADYKWKNNYNGRRWVENNQMYFYIGFLIIFITGIAGDIISPIMGAVYNGYAFAVTQVFSLFM